MFVSPFAKSKSCVHNELFDDGRAIRFQEEVFIRPAFYPKSMRHLLAFLACARRDDKRAGRLGIQKLTRQPIGNKQLSIDCQLTVPDFKGRNLSRIDPRVPMLCVPFPRPKSKFAGSVFQNVILRITQQPDILGIQNLDFRFRVDQLKHCSRTGRLQYSLDRGLGSY